jgi:hypothetical protein
MDVNELEKSNRAKYGDKEFDQISLNYRKGTDYGDIWASENVKRYLDRFTRPGSTKAKNLTDLLKARDYLNRMIEVHENLNTNKKEVIE